MEDFIILHFNSVTSTQEVAKSLMKENTVIVADEQRAGRGRRGRRWIAPVGGLWFTVILRDSWSTVPTLAAGVAVARALRLKGVNAGIKWPNDVLLHGKKVAGILAEHVDGKILLGVGINLKNEIPEELKDIATGLPDLDPGELLRLILEEMKKIDDAKSTIAAWRELNVTLGKEVCVDDVYGTAVDIGEDGALIIDTGKGSERVYSGTLRFIQRED